MPCIDDRVEVPSRNRLLGMYWLFFFISREAIVDTVPIDLKVGLPVSMKFWSSILLIVDSAGFLTVFVFENF